MAGPDDDQSGRRHLRLEEYTELDLVEGIRACLRPFMFQGRPAIRGDAIVKAAQPKLTLALAVREDQHLGAKGTWAGDHGRYGDRLSGANRSRNPLIPIHQATRSM